MRAQGIRYRGGVPVDRTDLLTTFDRLDADTSRLMSALGPYQFQPTSSSPASASAPPTSSGPVHEYPQAGPVHDSPQAGPSTAFQQSSPAGYTDDASVWWSDLVGSMDHPDPEYDVMGSSQFGGAPPPFTQPTQFETPPQQPPFEPHFETRPQRPARAHTPASRLSYPTDHVHAQQRQKRTRRGRGG